MAKNSAKRRGRKPLVAEAAEKQPPNLTPNGGKRRRPNQPCPASPVSTETRSPPSRRSPRAANANGAAKTANAVVACCSPKSPRKRLFADSPQNRRWNPRDPDQINAVKEAFHLSSAPVSVACREFEQMQILEFCKDRIKQDSGGSLYICGCPGTGKTLSVHKVEALLISWTKEVGLQEPVTVKLNCNSFSSVAEIFPKILERCPFLKMNGDASPLHQLRDSLSQRSPQCRQRSTILAIVDELDYLITKDRAVLHDLFTLTSIPHSRFILIGIANAIDLADRFLPKLESMNCKPGVITFRAYNKDQILEILHQRLAAVGYYDVFEPLALEFCARKVAAASGDMRKALSVCMSAIDKLETDLKSETAARSTEMVSFEDVEAALSRAFRRPVVDTIQGLPQHQQMILCVLANLSTTKKTTSTLGNLNKSYLEVCKSVQVPAAGAMELSSMCRVLSDQGLVKLGNSREEKLKKVALAVDADDVTFSLKGIRFFRHCLE